MINDSLPTVLSNLSGKVRINSGLVDFNQCSKRDAVSLVAATFSNSAKCNFMLSNLKV